MSQAEVVEVTTDESVPVVRQPLTLVDKCDSCGAQAFVRAILLDGDLLFCGHHGKAYEAKLAEVAIVVEDHTDTINKKPSQSSV